MHDQAQIIAKRILSLKLDRPVRIPVDGFCAPGKTTFADCLRDGLTHSNRPVIRASADNFQNPPEIRWQLGKQSAEGFYRHAIDFGSMREHLLDPLDNSGNGRYRTSTYDIRNMEPDYSSLFDAKPDSLLIADGLFLLVPGLYPFWDFSVFIDASFESCITRAICRNQEQLENAQTIETRYRNRYVPGYQFYLDEIDPRSLADVIVRNDDYDLQPSFPG